MAGSPQVNQGALNRVRGSVVITDNPELNITAPFLGKGGISLSFDGPATVPMPTLTGTAQSPEPYQMATITVALLKTQSFSDLYKQRFESNTLLGDIVVTPDSPTLSPYQISNCSLITTREMTFDGTNPEYVVTIVGTYQINSALWGAL